MSAGAAKHAASSVCITPDKVGSIIFILSMHWHKTFYLKKGFCITTYKNTDSITYKNYYYYC